MSNRTMPICGYSFSQPSRMIQDWAGEVLDKITWAKQLQDLEHTSDSIILLEPQDANFHFDLTKKLIDQGNYLIFVNTPNDPDTDPGWRDLRRDLPDVERFSMIDCTNARLPNRFGLNTFLFETFSWDNMILAKKISTRRTTHRPYKFLFLNGHDRPHRRQIWSKIEQGNLLKQGLCSYLGYGNKTEAPLKLLPPEYDSKFADINTSAVDTHARSLTEFQNKVWQSQFICRSLDSIKKYTHTYFSLITETQCRSNDCAMITEKTYKSLLAGQPFLVLGDTGTLEHLRRIGFRTFSNLIDESYDDATDVDQKIELLVNETQRLCSMDLDKFVAACEPLTQHNQEMFLHIVYENYQNVHCELSDWIESVIALARSTS